MNSCTNSSRRWAGCDARLSPGGLQCDQFVARCWKKLMAVCEQMFTGDCKGVRGIWTYRGARSSHQVKVHILVLDWFQEASKNINQCPRIWISDSKLLPCHFASLQPQRCGTHSQRYSAQARGKRHSCTAPSLQPASPGSKTPRGTLVRVDAKKFKWWVDTRFELWRGFRRF